MSLLRIQCFCSPLLPPYGVFTNSWVINCFSLVVSTAFGSSLMAINVFIPDNGKPLCSCNCWAIVDGKVIFLFFFINFPFWSKAMFFSIATFIRLIDDAPVGRVVDLNCWIHSCFSLAIRVAISNCL